jgi:excisionase family DNA binding protein
MDEILTVEEMAQYLKVSRSTVWRWCNEGKVPAFKVGRGWRVHRAQLEKIMGQKIGKVAEPKRKANGRS